MSYTSDNDEYFPNSNSEIHGYRYAPTMIANTGRGFDWRPMLKPYFGNTLKNTWVCPMASDTFRDGAVKYSNNPTDIDTEANNVVTSYSHFFGRTADGGIQSNPDGYWGSGAAFFRLTEGIKKAGEVQKFDGPGSTYDDEEFRLLSADVAWTWWKQQWVHETYGQVPIQRPGSGTIYGEYASADVRAVGPPRLDLNYSTDDGAVRSLRGVTCFDENVTSSGDQAARGWLLPLPD